MHRCRPDVTVLFAMRIWSSRPSTPATEIPSPLPPMIVLSGIQPVGRRPASNAMSFDGGGRALDRAAIDEVP